MDGSWSCRFCLDTYQTYPAWLKKHHGPAADTATFFQMSSKTLTLGATKPTRHIFCHIPNLPGIFLKPLPNLPGIFLKPLPNLPGTLCHQQNLHKYNPDPVQTYPARIYSPIPNLPGTDLFTHTKPTRHGFIHPCQTYPAYFRKTYQTYPAWNFCEIPNLPGKACHTQDIAQRTLVFYL